MLFIRFAYNNKLKRSNKMKHVFKKTLAVSLIGLGLGILLVLLLPTNGWLFTIGISVICIGIGWLMC